MDQKYVLHIGRVTKTCAVCPRKCKKKEILIQILECGLSEELYSTHLLCSLCEHINQNLTNFDIMIVILNQTYFERDVMKVQKHFSIR